MPGISTCCLMTEPLPAALERLAPLTDLIEVMDEGPHLITDTGLFESYTQKFVLHAPFHGVNIASLFEPIRKASVQVTMECFEPAAAIGAVGIVVHPGYYAWEQERKGADRQFRKSSKGTETCGPRACGHVLVREHGEHELLQPEEHRRASR